MKEESKMKRLCIPLNNIEWIDRILQMLEIQTRVKRKDILKSRRQEFEGFSCEFFMPRERTEVERQKHIRQVIKDLKQFRSELLDPNSEVLLVEEGREIHKIIEIINEIAAFGDEIRFAFGEFAARQSVSVSPEVDIFMDFLKRSKFNKSSVNELWELVYHTSHIGSWGQGDESMYKSFKMAKSMDAFNKLVYEDYSDTFEKKIPGLHFGYYFKDTSDLLEEEGIEDEFLEMLRNSKVDEADEYLEDWFGVSKHVIYLIYFER